MFFFAISLCFLSSWPETDGGEGLNKILDPPLFLHFLNCMVLIFLCRYIVVVIWYRTRCSRVKENRPFSKKD